MDARNERKNGAQEPGVRTGIKTGTQKSRSGKTTSADNLLRKEHMSD